MKIQCIQYGNLLYETGAPGPAASISGGIMGDEYADACFFRPDYSIYTLKVYYDRFLGEGESLLRGPLSKAEGDELVCLINQCPEPWNKKCRCPAHRAYFGDSLD